MKTKYPLVWLWGSSVVVVTLVTGAAGYQYYQEAAGYVPPRPPVPPPTILYPIPPSTTVQDQDFLVLATIRPVEEDQVSAWVIHRFEGTEVSKQEIQSLEVKQVVHLLPGSNEIEIMARNQDAPPDRLEAETARVTVKIQYNQLPNTGEKPVINYYGDQPTASAFTKNQFRVEAKITPPVGKTATVKVFHRAGKIETVVRTFRIPEQSSSVLCMVPLSKGDNEIELVAVTSEVPAVAQQKVTARWGPARVTYQPPPSTAVPTIDYNGKDKIDLPSQDFRLKVSITPFAGTQARVRVQHRHPANRKPVVLDKVINATFEVDQSVKLLPGKNHLTIEVFTLGKEYQRASQYIEVHCSVLPPVLVLVPDTQWFRTKQGTVQKQLSLFAKHCKANKGYRMHCYLIHGDGKHNPWDPQLKPKLGKESLKNTEFKKTFAACYKAQKELLADPQLASFKDQVKIILLWGNESDPDTYANKVKVEDFVPPHPLNGLISFGCFSEGNILRKAMGNRNIVNVLDVHLEQIAQAMLDAMES